MSTAEIIAQGGEPVWKHTFTHPAYGELTFSAERTPTVRDWLRQAAEMASITPGIEHINPMSPTGQLAGAVSGIRSMLTRPAIKREEVPDQNVPGGYRIEQALYDPLEDEDISFPIIVWTEYVAWRAREIEKAVEPVKNSSGVTRGLDNADSSPASTTSPSTTLASVT